MHTLKVITPNDGKNCPQPGCEKREYLTRRHAGRDLSICPNGHSWDAVEVAAQQAKARQANEQEETSNYDFLRDSPITLTPAKPATRDRLLDRIQENVIRHARESLEPDRRDEPGIFRTPYPTFVDPLREATEQESRDRRRQRDREYEEIRKFETAPRIRMSLETFKAMHSTGLFSDSECNKLLGVPIIIDATIPPGLYVWSVQVENPFERFLKAMTKSVAEGFGLSPLAFEE